MRLPLIGRLDEPGARRILLITTIDAVGTGMFLATSLLYFTRVRDFSPSTIGLGQSLFAVAGIVSMVPLGRLADRIGPRRTAGSLYALQSVLFVVMIAIRSPWQYVVVIFLVGAAEWSTQPILRSVLGVLSEANRVQTLAVMSTLRNTGFAVGSGVAALALLLPGSAPFVTVVIVNSLSFVVAAALMRTVPLPDPSRHQETREATSVEDRPSESSQDIGTRPPSRTAFVLMSGLNGLLFLHTPLLMVILPLWVSTRTDAPASLVGGLLAVNTVLVIALQIPFGAGDPGLRSGARRHLGAGIALALCCAVVAETDRSAPVLTVVLVLVAVGLLSIGEMWQVSGAWRISYAMAPPGRQAAALAAYDSATTWTSALAPVVLTWLVVEGGAPGWWGLVVLFLVVGAGTQMTASRLVARS